VNCVELHHGDLREVRLPRSARLPGLTGSQRVIHEGAGPVKSGLSGVSSVFLVVPGVVGQACVRCRGQGAAPAGEAEDERPWGRHRARHAGGAGTKRYREKLRGERSQRTTDKIPWRKARAEWSAAGHPFARRWGHGV